MLQVVVVKRRVPTASNFFVMCGTLSGRQSTVRVTVPIGMEATEAKEKVTGFKPDAKNPTVAAPPLSLTSEQLPLYIEFNGRHYVILETKNRKLVMNGA